MPTFTGPQILERLAKIDKDGAACSAEVLELDNSIEELQKELRALTRKRASVAQGVGDLRDMKAGLNDLLLIARARFADIPQN